MATTTDVANVRQQANEEQVQVDLSNMIGRIKPKPVCLDATLRIQATSSDEISKVIFSTGFGSWMQKTSSKTVYDIGSQALSVVSSGSSTASRENGMSDATFHGTNESNDDAKQKVIATMPSSDGFAEGDFLRRKEESERMNLKIKTQTISRNGRQTQRYYTDPATSFLYRMTTGCIPILEDGKILLCSASRKCEWIIPKGGWENDEVMEESAIRETYEEAGVFGIIGPRLGEIAYETRKGKKRRIEFEQVQRKVKQIRESQSFGPKAKAVSPSGNDGIVPCLDMADFSKDRVSSSASIDSCRFTPDVDNLSVASETSLGQTHIKMSLFPLYVTEVLDEWPEQGRFRKVVDIDEAIRITEIRPYFQAALKELKERHLHVCPELQRDKLMSNTIRMTSVTRTENSMGEI
mmetsp:Transcript_8589/g.16942  ORF Transcript_8589/g.16942 Transcript_8589/m.16942 type:complete len:408 (+) Transcript_8589:349-1572(+)